MTAQMKHLIDSTASLWLNGETEGEPTEVFHDNRFYSTHDGQETLSSSLIAHLREFVRHVAPR